MHEARHIGIGPRVRAARERLGLSREALAYHSGVSWSGIAQVEAGRRTNLRPGTLLALARALGVTIDYLVAGGAQAGSMFEHRLLLYATDAEFLASAVPFLAEAVERPEPALAVLSAAHIRALRRRLGARARDVEFAEQSTWYRAPATALAGYRAFVFKAIEAGAPWVRILGEPVWTGRSAPELRLSAQYESLLNLVFSHMPVTLLCPYDTRELDATVLEYARATHPDAVEHEALMPSPQYTEPATFLLQP